MTAAYIHSNLEQMRSGARLHPTSVGEEEAKVNAPPLLPEVAI